MASTMTFLSRVDSRRDFSQQYPTALNKQLLSLAITRLIACMSSSRMKSLVDVEMPSTPSFMLIASARANASSSSMFAMLAYVVGAAAIASELATAASSSAIAVTASVSPPRTPNDAHNAASSSTSTSTGGKPSFHFCARVSTPVAS